MPRPSALPRAGQGSKASGCPSKLRPQILEERRDLVRLHDGSTDEVVEAARHQADMLDAVEHEIGIPEIDRRAQRPVDGERHRVGAAQIEEEEPEARIELL